MIVANWKMNLNLDEACNLAQHFVNHSSEVDDLVLCPSFPYLTNVFNIIQKSNVKLGAQDCHWADHGAYTGDVSAYMLKNIGCDFVILGHSERRMGHLETNETVLAKAKSAISAGVIPIICVGETEEQYDNGLTKEVLEKQIKNSCPSGGGFVLAYEPIWAIGTGKIAKPDELYHIYKHINSELDNDALVLYGGSVNASNSQAILEVDGVGGLLVGGASLKAEEFTKIYQS